jgi:DNA-binding MarR family transcriptional regulator
MGDALLAASRALVGVAARSVADLGDVTLPQFRALVLISARPGTKVSELADALDVHSTTASRLCDRLVDKRLVRRSHGTDDRRSIELHLTAPGRRLVDRVTERRRRDLTAIASRMPAATSAGAVSALLAFAEAAGDEVGPVDVFGWDVAADKR